MKKYVLVENGRAYATAVYDEAWLETRDDVFEVPEIPNSDFLYWVDGKVVVNIRYHMLRMKLLVEREYKRIITEKDPPDNKKAGKLAKAMRREFKGTANIDDLKLLDDNDIIDEWYDTMDSVRDTEEAWLEDPARTDEEILAYDPLAVPWPAYPL